MPTSSYKDKAQGHLYTQAEKRDLLKLYQERHGLLRDDLRTMRSALEETLGDTKGVLPVLKRDDDIPPDARILLKGTSIKDLSRASLGALLNRSLKILSMLSVAYITADTQRKELRHQCAQLEEILNPYVETSAEYITIYDRYVAGVEIAASDSTRDGEGDGEPPVTPRQSLVELEDIKADS